MPRPLRGEVWTVRFDPAEGAEIQKIRPAVVLGMDSIGRLPLKIVVPITDWKDADWFMSVVAAIVGKRLTYLELTGKLETEPGMA